MPAAAETEHRGELIPADATLAHAQAGVVGQHESGGLFGGRVVLCGAVHRGCSMVGVAANISSSMPNIFSFLFRKLSI
jgi:hypothetical protein